MRQGHSLGGRYRLDERIASGGMGEVWRGFDDRLNRVVAVKVLHHALAGDEVFQHRFEAEAHAIATLRHPGVVNIFDYGEEEGDHGQIVYLVMEHVDGQSLQQLLAERVKLEPDETLRIIAESAEALAAAHSAGIIHRDVKPGNILIDSSGAARLVDFGIARTAGAAGVTNTGMVMGTAAYVAPEQLRGDNDPAPAVDIYSLGVVAYLCLSGRRPFDSEIPAGLLASALHEEPPPLTDIPEAIAAIVMRALAKDPDARWESAADFAAACRGPSDAPAPVREAAPAAGHEVPGPPTPVDRPRRRGVRATLVALLALLLVGVAGGAAALRPWEETRDPQANEAGKTLATTQEESSSSSSSSSSSTDRTTESPEPTTSSASPSSSSTSAEPEAGELPYTEGLSEDEAYKVLERDGFENVETTIEGDGTKVCGVYRQTPEGGEEYDFDTEVTVFVQTVDDLTNCRYVGGG